MNNDFDNIIDTIYVGNKNASKQCAEFYIIVNCTKDIPNQCDNNTIRIPVDDSPDESDNMLEYILNTKVLEKMHECVLHNKKVLVHCRAGIQRSATVVVCYLIKYYHMGVYQAITYLQKQRPVAFFGHINFIKTIEDFYSLTQIR
jgi:protein-tyrosine phosphatase